MKQILKKIKKVIERWRGTARRAQKRLKDKFNEGYARGFAVGLEKGRGEQLQPIFEIEGKIEKERRVTILHNAYLVDGLKELLADHIYHYKKVVIDSKDAHEASEYEWRARAIERLLKNMFAAHKLVQTVGGVEHWLRKPNVVQWAQYPQKETTV